MGWEEDAGLTVPRPLGWGGSGDCCSRYLTGPQEPLLQTCPSCLHLQPQSLSRLISFLKVSFFFSPVLHILQVHENIPTVFLYRKMEWSVLVRRHFPEWWTLPAAPQPIPVRQWRRALLSQSQPQPQLGAASTTSEGSMHYRSRELTARILTFLLGLLRELQGRDAQSKCCALGTLSCCYHPDWLSSWLIIH